MRALLLILATLSVSAANAFTIKNVITPPAGTPGKVKLIVTPGEITNLGKLDLLIVVDDSGSMADHQTILSRNVPALAAKLAQFSSLNVAVTTSSMENKNGGNGKFFIKPANTPAVLNNTLPNFQNILTQRLIVGTSGASDEQFFAPTVAALSAPLIDTVNKDFIRPDAHLGVVFVTDTDDQSPNVSPEQFIVHLATLKGANYTLINFIADPADRNCSSQNPGKMPERLALAKYMANGSQYNICQGKFADGVSDVASKVERELQSKIALPMKPNVSTIKVTYGALTFPANDPQNGWTYDEPTNTLILGTKIDFNVLPAADLIIEFTL